MRLAILASIIFVLSTSATLFAFAGKDGQNAPAAAGGSADLQPASMPKENGCATENESGPGFNRSTVHCTQEATSAPQSSSGPSSPTPAMPEPAVTPAAPAQPQAQAAPQSTYPGDADPACVTEHESGDGWERTTVRCNRRSESAGSSTSSSSVVTSSSVSVSSSTSNGTP